MTLYRYTLLLFYVVLSFTITAQEFDNYKLSVDDEISVTVFQEPELSIRKMRISTDGNISLPLIGQVKVQELTITEVEAQITKRLLNGYLKKPDVSVSISQYRPFYINGEVKKPGSYAYRKNLTIEKAVTLAGGFTNRASKSAISLSREDTNLTLNEVTLDQKIKPGDVITINESFF